MELVWVSSISNFHVEMYFLPVSPSVRHHPLFAWSLQLFTSQFFIPHNCLGWLWWEWKPCYFVGRFLPWTRFQQVYQYKSGFFLCLSRLVGRQDTSQGSCGKSQIPAPILTANGTSWSLCWQCILPAVMFLKPSVYVPLVSYLRVWASSLQATTNSCPQSTQAVMKMADQTGQAV